MIRYNVTPLFSTPLLSANIGVLDTQTKDWVKSLTYPPLGVGHDGQDLHLPAKERGFTIIDAPELSDLKSKIKEAVDYFVYELLDVDFNVEFVFSTSWINRIENGGHIDLHDHSNAIISGVYYIDVSDNASPITFTKNNRHLNTFPSSTKPITNGRHWNQFNCDVYTIQPKDGDILIFPSHLEHYVGQSIDPIYRYGIAFNLFCKGTVGQNSTKVTI